MGDYIGVDRIDYRDLYSFTKTNEDLWIAIIFIYLMIFLKQYSFKVSDRYIVYNHDQYRLFYPKVLPIDVFISYPQIWELSIRNIDKIFYSNAEIILYLYRIARVSWRDIEILLKTTIGPEKSKAYIRHYKNLFISWLNEDEIKLNF